VQGQGAWKVQAEAQEEVHAEEQEVQEQEGHGGVQ
jgi:hypothetical protein